MKRSKYYVNVIETGYVSIEEVIKTAQEEAIDETIKACAEYSNHKETIFKIGEQLKSQL